MKHFSSSKSSGAILLLISLVTACTSGKSVISPENSTFSDERYSGGAQIIPGKVQLEYYNLGGEGIAYHESDTINSGSGRLNPADGSYLNEFRIKEAVDISYTKSRDIDDNKFNLVQPEMDQLYVGWTEPGEWIMYTVDVQTPGTYQIGIMYTSNAGGHISLSVNGDDKTGPMAITTTNDPKDQIAWRQWHHWNYSDSIGTVKLKKGIQKITLHTVSVGNMNFDYLNFKLVTK
ncbi:MAG: carbohydrate-binding protein [Algoriphagus sp.]|nr:carbohydrate-binding protein [Algoriphagus sp.]